MLLLLLFSLHSTKNWFLSVISVIFVFIITVLVASDLVFVAVVVVVVVVTVIVVIAVLLLGPEGAMSIFPFLNGRCHLEQSLPFRTIVYCRFQDHAEDKVLITEIQQILTLTLIQTRINSKRRN